MFQQFYPDKWVDSAYGIDYEALYQQGKRGIIFDIDNTLVPHGAPADERAITLFHYLKEIGFEACLLSNNHEKRVLMFNKDVQVHYICDAHKPSVKSYQEAMKMMHTDENTTIFIGDQLFTDVFGAKRAHIHAILVNPIHPKEEIQIVFKRYLEKIVLYFYVKKGNQQERTEKRR